jgi:two-component system phosphate regulon sensor histidine kinase PhoR
MSRSVSASAFEALIAKGSGLLVLIDPGLRIQRAGSGAAELAGRSAEEMAGMSLIAAFGSASLDAVARAALASGEATSGEAQLGQVAPRSFAVEAVPLGSGALLSLHEITALRRAERARRDFVANISHELRTPLTSIKLLAETLSAGAVGDPGSAQDFAMQIEREVDHLSQLVDELLDLARIESGDVALAIVTLHPADALAALAERIAPMAERHGVRIRLEDAPPDADEAMAAADPERLGQALLNLAHNAVKYSRRGDEVRLGWSATSDSIRFQVSDDGIGVPAAHQSRIFERFYKVDRSRAREESEEPQRASAGLGLAIVRHIAEAHGGSVGLRSTEGVGSTFWIEVPRAGD